MPTILTHPNVPPWKAHPPAWYGNQDPTAGSNAASVLPWHFWVWVDNDAAPTTYELYVRNGANTAWELLANSSSAGGSYIPTSAEGVAGGVATLDANGHVAAAQVASYHDDGNSGAALALDFSAYATHKITLTANCTLTFNNPTPGGVYVLHLTQDATGSRTVTWPATVKWAGGAAPTLTATASKRDIVTLSYDGTNYYGVVSGQNY